MRRLWLFVFIIAWLAGAGFTQVPRTEELLALGRQLGNRYGNHIWPRFSQTPFPVLLLEKAGERLFCPQIIPEGFNFIGHDIVTDCQVYHRADNHFAREMQATFFPVGRFPVVVMGEPELSENNPAAWTATLLHEHFHQHQMSWSGYRAAVMALDHDNDGAKANPAISYQFIYDDAKTVNLLALLAQYLTAILREPDRTIAIEMAGSYARLRPLVLAGLAPEQQLYFEFQLWQEGVARYTEIALSEFAASDTTSVIGNEIDFAALAANLRKDMMQSLANSSLSQQKHAYFYSFGAAEALVLDIVNSNWRQRYFESPLSMAGYFAAIADIDGQ